MPHETALKTRAPATLFDAGVATEHQDFLRTLGARVRAVRVERGMSRKLLAQQSGVSERYLANLESGQGNVSVLLLRQVAHALGTSATAFLEDGLQQTGEGQLIVEFIKRLPAQKLAQVHAHLIRKFGSSAHQRRNRIALVGLRGAGKSTLGARLAKALGVPFVELDKLIEAEAGTSLSEIFLLYGQAGYRRYERRCLENILRQHERCVLAAGGSIVSDAGTYELLLSSCFTVWLKARPEQHMARVLAQGDTRPMAGNRQAMDDLRRILAARSTLYSQADAVVDTSSGTPAHSFNELRKVISA